MNRSFMRFTSAVVFAFGALSTSKVASGKTTKDEAAALKADGAYWSRFLDDYGSLATQPPSSPPTYPPTPGPTPYPTTPYPTTPFPTTPPTVPPMACDIDLVIDCATVNGGIACSNINGIQNIQCVNTPPTELCFRYTGGQCDPTSTTSGLLSCTDFNGGPKSESHISITDGSTSLVDGTFSTGDDFCVSTSGSVLPSQ